MDGQIIQEINEIVIPAWREEYSGMPVGTQKATLYAAIELYIKDTYPDFKTDRHFINQFLTQEGLSQ